MKKVEEDRIPEFKTLEEEREYWEARSGLAPGHKGRWSNPRGSWSERKSKLSSYLVVRLTGEEITKLRDIAVKKGLGTSTYARTVLTGVIEQENKTQVVTLDDVKQAAEHFITSYDALKKASKEDVLVARDRERQIK